MRALVFKNELIGGRLCDDPARRSPFKPKRLSVQDFCPATAKNFDRAKYQDNHLYGMDEE